MASRTKKKLPPPPSTGGRPLPPEPQRGDDAPPPLPSRPAPSAGGRRAVPPPPSNGPASPSPSNSTSSDLQEDETYEEPGSGPPIPPPARNQPSRPVPSLPSQPQQFEEPGEMYDDLEGVGGAPNITPVHISQPPPQDDFGETYDACDFNEQDGGANEELEEEETYDEKAEFPVPPDEDLHPSSMPAPPLIEDSIYEGVADEPIGRSSPAPPPLPSHPAPSKPLAPPLPADDRPQLPNRPSPKMGQVPKKPSGGNVPAPGMSINMAELQNRRGVLRKVSSESEPDHKDTRDGPQEEDLASAASGVKAAKNLWEKRAAGGSVGGTKVPFKPPAGPKPQPPGKAAVHVNGMSPAPPPLPGGREDKHIDKPPPLPAAKVTPIKSTPYPKPADDWPAEFEDTEGGEEIYDDTAMFFDEDPLSEYPWYHGSLERKEGDDRVKSKPQNGTFLVRKSSKGGEYQPYSLVVFFDNHVYNLMIRVRNDKRVALGKEKPDELTFKDVPELIAHHELNDVILVNAKLNKQFKTLLKNSPRKS